LTFPGICASAHGPAPFRQVFELWGAKSSARTTGAIENGKSVRVVTPFESSADLFEGSMYRWEIEYLESKGYESTKVGDEFFMAKK
jgi:hypothetical protein